MNRGLAGPPSGDEGGEGAAADVYPAVRWAESDDLGLVALDRRYQSLEVSAGFVAQEVEASMYCFDVFRLVFSASSNAAPEVDRCKADSGGDGLRGVDDAVHGGTCGRLFLRRNFVSE
jgi:hypothetical protein